MFVLAFLFSVSGLFFLFALVLFCFFLCKTLQSLCCWTHKSIVYRKGITSLVCKAQKVKLAELSGYRDLQAISINKLSTKRVTPSLI